MKNDCIIFISSNQTSHSLLHIKCSHHDIMLAENIDKVRIDKALYKDYPALCRYLRQQAKKAVKKSKNTIHECEIKCDDHQVYCSKHHIRIASLKDNYDYLRMEQELEESTAMRDHCACICNIRRTKL